MQRPRSFGVFMGLVLTCVAGVPAAPGNPSKARSAGLSSLPIAAQGSIWAKLGRGLPTYQVRVASGVFDGTTDTLMQLAELTASDGGAEDFLGPVGISGNTVVVGAFGVNGKQGEAYIFVEPASGWTNMTETAKLTASDGLAGDGFGSSVAIDGNTVVIGAPGANGNQGAVYVFVEPANGWTNMMQTAKLTASNGVSGDQLGYSVSISNNTVVAGADSAASGAGAAYVFVKPVGGWTSATQRAELTASDGAVSDFLGVSVAVSGSMVVAGAPNATHSGNNAGTGAGYVFVRPSQGWANTTETAKLTVSPAKDGQGLGSSVALSPTTAVLGAPDPLVYGPGAAYVFVKPTRGWVNMTQTARLTASGGRAGAALVSRPI